MRRKTFNMTTLSGLATAIALALVVAAGGGCDDSNDGISPDLLAARERAQRQIEELAKLPPKPTTQELMSAPRKRVTLGDFPLSIEVPQSWQLKSDGFAFLVAGTASSGDIELQFNKPASPPILRELLPRALQEAKSLADAKPHPFNKVEMRDLNDGAKVLEERMISTPFVDGKLPPERMEEMQIGDPTKGPTLTTRAVVNPHMMKWVFTVYLPEGADKYSARVLSFRMLQVSEFTQDREFLEKMMGTLKYEK